MATEGFRFPRGGNPKRIRFKETFVFFRAPVFTKSGENLEIFRSLVVTLMLLIVFFAVFRKIYNILVFYY